MLPSYDFDMEYKKAKKKEEEIKQFITKRSENVSKGISTASIDAKLKIKLDDFINSINSIKLKVCSNNDLNSSNRSKQSSNNSQLDELLKIYKNLKKEFDELKISVNNSIENSAYKSRRDDDNDKPINTRQEYETIKENKLKEGEEIFDELRGQAKMIKTGAVMINDQLKMQEPLLDKLNNNFDKVEGKLKRTENKLANYLNKSSSSCLYYTILAEFVLLILFFAI